MQPVDEVITLIRVRRLVGFREFCRSAFEGFFDGEVVFHVEEIVAASFSVEDGVPEVFGVFGVLLLEDAVWFEVLDNGLVVVRIVEWFCTSSTCSARASKRTVHGCSSLGGA